MNFTRFKSHLMKIGAPALCSLLLILMAGCGPKTPGKVAAPPVPETLQVSASEVLSFSARARGFQIYECRAKKDDPAQHEWVLKAPEADLFDAEGKKIGHHFGGPTWQSSDGSKVVGEVKGREPGSEPNAIPWLLLGAKSHEGDGVFSRVSSIQRLETTGGKAPAEGCDQSGLGKEARVPYTAVYYFYVPKS